MVRKELKNEWVLLLFVIVANWFFILSSNNKAILFDKPISHKMENFYNDLQFWKNLGYYGGGLFLLLSAIVGARSYYKVSQIENLIRIETKKEEDKAKTKDSVEAAKERAKFFDRMD